VTTQENDPFLTFDAAYVLGSLSPEDRHAFELHLRGCAECSRSVRELAGLPGLLSQVHPDLAAVEPMPAGLLPAVLDRVRRSRRRRTLLTGTSLIVAVAAAVTLVVSVVLPGPPAEPTAGPAETTMTALGNFPVQAAVGLTDQAWGTRVVMSCSYHGSRSGDYVLVAVRHGGAVAQLASWHAMANDTARLEVGTALRRSDIQALEVRTTSGIALLRLSP
jgi:anti-sigma factor RsiW